MQLGRLIAQGYTSEIYEYGNDLVLKLFYDRYSKEQVEQEAWMTQLANDLGAPSASMEGIVQKGQRWGLVLEHVKGDTMTGILGPKPWKILPNAKKFAQVHAKIHSITTDEFPSQKEELRKHIITSRGRLGRKNADLIMERLESLPELHKLCHNDIHQENIIFSGNGPVVLDWPNAHSGNPAADVVNALMIQERAQPIPSKPNTSKFYLRIHNRYRMWFASLYLKEYMNLTNITKEEVDKWFLPVAASRLVSQTRKEKDWTEQFIRHRLKRESGVF